MNQVNEKIHSLTYPQMLKFVADREKGWNAEKELIRRLQLLGISAHQNTATDLKGKQKNDIVIDSCPYDWMYNTADTIEVKTDLQWMYTGNVAVEWEAMKHSNAHFVSYFLDDCFFEQPRGDLMWKIYENHKTKKWPEVRAGDWHAMATLIPVSAFIAPCKTLSRLPQDVCPDCI